MFTDEYTTKRWNPLTGPPKPTFHPERLSEPERWRKPQIVACNFMGDWMDEGHPCPDIYKAVYHMALYSEHTFLTLTKQPQNILRWLEFMNNSVEYSLRKWGAEIEFPENVYNGLTITNQQDADEKLPIFLKISGKKWLSLESLCGPIDLSPYLPNNYSDGTPVFPHKEYIDQLIIGAMSGPLANKYPLDMAWVRQIIDDCAAAGVPCFVKQIHKVQINLAGGRRVRVSKEPGEWPPEFRVRQLAWGEK